MKVTLKNDFHNTSATIQVSGEIKSNDLVAISAEQYNRARNELCGIDGCTCGVTRGGKFRLIADRSAGQYFIQPNN